MDTLDILLNIYNNCFLLLQADVLSTVRAVNKSISVDNTRGDNNLHLNSVEDTPLKKKKENRNRPSSPCPGGSPLELLPLS